MCPVVKMDRSGNKKHTSGIGRRILDVHQNEIKKNAIYIKKMRLQRLRKKDEDVRAAGS